MVFCCRCVEINEKLLAVECAMWKNALIIGSCDCFNKNKKLICLILTLFK